MIKTVIFDMGGVIITLGPEEATRRFEALGLKDAAEQLDSYTQKGIFGQLERGDISADDFRRELSLQVGRELTYEECQHAWLGYFKEVPQRNLDALTELRRRGYRLVLLSNTNPYVMDYILSPRFDGGGRSLADYLDSVYLSFKMKVMKPDELFFRRVLMAEQIPPSECLFIDDGIRNVAAASQLGMFTICPENGEDWTTKVFDFLNKQ
ncbi:MAG: HAD family phosphatase [Prevotella sp.]|jgi:putative hydrolase of the HAD superfamily|nr:HAD family phosphatase [Prevotella sp.]